MQCVLFFRFFFNDTATTEIYTLSLHDALPIFKSWELGKQNYRLLLDSHGGALYRRQFMKVAERRIKNSDSFTDQFFEYVKSPLLNLNLLKDDYKHEAITNSKTALKKFFDSIEIGRASCRERV